MKSAISSNSNVNGQRDLLSSSPKKQTRFKFRISLSGILLSIFGISVGAAVQGLEWFDWTDGLSAGCAALISVGLIQQACDLWRVQKTDGGINSNELWGIRFSIIWRLAVVVSFILIFSSYAYSAWFAQNSDEEYYILGPPKPVIRELASALQVLVLLIVYYRPRRRQPTPYRWLNPLRYILALTLMVIVLREQTIIHFLTHLSVVGIEFGKLTSADLNTISVRLSQIDPLGNGRIFFRVTSIGFAVSVFSFYTVFRISKTSRRSLQRTTWTLLLVVEIISLLMCIGWIYRTGIDSILESLNEAAIPVRHWSDWAAGLILVFIPCWLVTMRLAMPGRSITQIAIRKVSSTKATPIHWHPLFLFILTASFLWSWVWEIIKFAWDKIRGEPTLMTIWDWILGTITMPSITLNVVICFVLIGLWIQRFRGNSLGSQLAFRPISLARFLFFLPIVFGLSILSLIVTSWFAYAIWLSSWYL